MDKTQLLQAQLQSEQGTVGAPIPVTGTSAVPTLGCTAFQVWTADTIIASITIIAPICKFIIYNFSIFFSIFIKQVIMITNIMITIITMITITMITII